MTFVDPIGDMLTRIRNGQMRSLNKITIPFSVFRSKILEVLKKEGYIIVIRKGKTVSCQASQSLVEKSNDYCKWRKEITELNYYNIFNHLNSSNNFFWFQITIFKKTTF